MMDVLDKFFKKFAYKFPKGYPDMNNEQDILLLETILSELGINLNEIASPNSIQAKNILKKEFDLNDDNFVDISSNSFKVLVDGSERNDFIKKVSDLDDFEHELKGASSVGRLVYQPENFKRPILITVKPKSAQALGSAGKLNEFSFNNLINSSIAQNEGPITVILKSSDKTITVPNVAKAQDSSAMGADEFSKSDSQLLDPSLKTVLLNVSLKKRNAIRWESSKTRPIGGINIFKSFIEKVGKIGTDNEKGAFDNVVLYPLDRSGKYKLYDPKNGKILSKVIVTNIPDDIEDKVIFGTDDPKTVIVKETFEGGYDDYSFEDGVLTLNCYIIYTDFEDIKDTQDEPVFAFSNHIGQSYGIEFRSFSKGALYSGDDLKGSSTEINFNDLK